MSFQINRLIDSSNWFTVSMNFISQSPLVV